MRRESKVTPSECWNPTWTELHLYLLYQAVSTLQSQYLAFQKLNWDLKEATLIAFSLISVKFIIIYYCSVLLFSDFQVFISWWTTWTCRKNRQWMLLTTTSETGLQSSTSLLAISDTTDRIPKLPWSLTLICPGLSTVFRCTRSDNRCGPSLHWDVHQIAVIMTT